jgi:hypothetical protein
LAVCDFSHTDQKSGCAKVDRNPACKVIFHRAYAPSELNASGANEPRTNTTHGLPDTAFINGKFGGGKTGAARAPAIHEQHRGEV